MAPYKFEYDLNHPLRSLEHKKILLSKKSLKNIYTNWYKLFKTYVSSHKTYIELGSGGGFIKEIIPDIITSDINEIPEVDKYFSALDLPFEDNSISGIFMIDAFHHFPNVGLFLKEATRILKKGSKIVMVEPWNTAWSRFIYKKFHHELFDEKRDWTFPQSGPLSGSNMALPFIVFKRDINKFKHEFPKLKVNRIHPHTPFAYLLTGGFSRKPFMPGFIIKCIVYIENSLSVIRNKFAMFATIEIEKVED